jgi:hypothetical protein
MNQNPYQPPNPYGPPPPGYPQGPMYAPPNRNMFVLAGVAAMLAAGYWGVLALLALFGSMASPGTISPIQSILPIVLVVLYLMRGLRLFKCDYVAAKRIVVLHVIGAIAAVLQMRYGGSVWMTLQGIKVAINVFGAITAYLASRPG